jgi:propanol-preferring alcohol dehydrogenase
MDSLAMALAAPGSRLAPLTRAVPDPGPGQILIAVTACGVCRTDLHIVDGELAPPRFPIVPGHEVIGVVAATGPGARLFRRGERVGVPWLGGSCGHCRHCAGEHENLCDAPVFTGFSRDGGFAEHVVADERFCLPVPGGYDDLHAAPLLCAGLIGYRAYAMAPGAMRLGLYGFGAAAHLVAQLARHGGREVFAFTRPGDARSQAFARELGCAWAGGSDERPPGELDAAILFAPVGSLVPAALAATRKGGTVVCAGIHMSDIPAFPYRLLWGERTVRSVANLTRADGQAFMALAGSVRLDARPVAYPLLRANDALDDLRRGAFDGAAVLTVA